MKIVLLMITALLLSSCSKAVKNEKVSLAFVTNGPADFWLYCQAGVEKAGRELGVDVQFKVGDMTTAKQKQIVDDLLVSGYIVFFCQLLCIIYVTLIYL